MSYAIFKEVLFVIFLFIQPNNSLHAKFLEYLNILFRMMSIPLIGISLLNRTHECHEFSWNNPINVTILHSLIVFIFFNIECTEVVPFILDCILQALKTLQQSALIQAVSFTGITVRLEKGMIWPEHVLCFLSRALQNNYHECSH